MNAVSGIVGFLSFSITICNGLVQYYQSWSSREEAVNDLLQGLTNLHLILDLFREPFAELSAEQIGDEALGHITALEHRLRARVMSRNWRKSSGAVRPTMHQLTYGSASAFSR